MSKAEETNDHWWTPVAESADRFFRLDPAGRKLAENRIKLWQLSYGEHRFNVGAYGMEDQAATVVVQPGVVAEVCVVFAPPARE